MPASAARTQMVERQLVRRGVRDQRVLRAMRDVPREAFVEAGMEEFAFDDLPLPIGEGQTISQPYIVALMTDLLRLEGGERVLEIGTGCGYQAAVLAEIAGNVHTIEIVDRLADQAARTLKRLKYRNVHTRTGDGYGGWPEAAPFDAIIVSAGGPDVPAALKQQLAIGGRMIIPVGGAEYQSLLKVRRVTEALYDTEELAQVRFVPLVGVQGWTEDGRIPRRAEHRPALPRTLP